MMDLYSLLVEGLCSGSTVSALGILLTFVFCYLMWCGIGIYSNLEIMGLFALAYFWITGNMLLVFIILAVLLFGVFMESKRDLSDA